MTSRGVEVGLADLAAAQWGLVTTSQAQTAGVARTHLNRLAAAGVLVRLTHGVYAMRTSAGEDLLDLRCAWLTLDPTRLAADRLADSTPTAVVSHASAAHLHGHGDLLADRHEFTVPTRKQTRRPELRLHRGDFLAADVTVHHGLPVTTPTRTVLDLLTAHHDGEHVAGVLAGAVRAHQVDLDDLAPRLAPFASRFGLPHCDGDAVLAHLLELGDVTHEVEATALAAMARMANTSTSDYLAHLASTLASQHVLDTFAAISESVRRQIEPPAAVLAAVQAMQVPLIEPPAAVLAAVQAMQVPLIEQIDAALQSPGMKAALESVRRQIEPSAAVLAAVQPVQTARFLEAIQAAQLEQLRTAVQTSSAAPLQQMLESVRPLQVQVDQIAQAAQAPDVKAALEQIRSPQIQAQVAAVRSSPSR